MKVDFIHKVLFMGSVDTKKYRYVAKDCGDFIQIRRIELDKLDTVSALDGWSVVDEVYAGNERWRSKLHYREGCQ